jgi:7-cyano-7-deazaguanine synthase
MQKVVIILSGGMDSGVLLATLAEEGEKEIHTLTFDYGSKHNKKEILCAQGLAKKYKCASANIIDLKFIGKKFKSDLLKTGGDIPEGHYEAENMKSTVVPFRNGIMLSIGAGFAESIGAEYIYYGAHAGDHHIYPDCRPEFADAMKSAIYNGTEKNICLETPFMNSNKRSIATLGKQLGFDFSITWTCYKAQAKHCGCCGSCNERREALEGFDTTEYEK